MRWKQITSIGIGVVALLAVIVLLMRPAKQGNRQTTSPPLLHPGEATNAPGISSCIASPLVPREFLDSKHVAAMALVYQKHFDTGVPALRNIAVADPGFPGINLDISDALLQSHHAQEAKSAINSQIAISDCLVDLPDQALQTYCEMELAQSSKDSCRTQLTQTQRAAHFQAALIDMDLANNIQPSSTVVLASDTSNTRAPLSLADAAAPVSESAKSRPAPAKPTTTAIPSPPIAVPAANPAPPKPMITAAAAPPKPVATASATPPKPVAIAAAAPPKTIATVSPTPSPSPSYPIATVPTTSIVHPPQGAGAPSESAETASGTLVASEASQHVGETRTVCGPVVGKHTAAGANGAPTFVELDRPYPNQIFTVLIWGSDKAVVGELPSTGKVCVTGKITSYAGMPEIVLHGAKDWSVPNNP